MKITGNKHKIFRNLDIRIVSLVLAVTLWLYASTERYYKLTFHCPIVVRNIPEGYSLSQCPSPVVCDVTAKGKDLIAFQVKNPTIVIDADNLQIRTLKVKLTQEYMVLPFGLKTRSIYFPNDVLEIKMDKLAEKEMFVKPDIIGEPADGYVLSDSILTEPVKVLLQGPARQLDQTDTIYSLSIRIDGMYSPQTITSALQLPDACLFKAVPESVKLYLKFEKSGEKVFKNVPLSVSNRSKTYLIGFSPGTIDLVVSGPKKVLDSTTVKQLKVFLDLENLLPGKYQLQATIELPDKLMLIAANPRYFEVSIK